MLSFDCVQDHHGISGPSGQIKLQRGKVETHGMLPCSVPLYVPSGKEVTVVPSPSVRGKKATGLGTSAVNIGGYIFPEPADDCPAMSIAPIASGV